MCCYVQGLLIHCYVPTSVRIYFMKYRPKRAQDFYIQAARGRCLSCRTISGESPSRAAPSVLRGSGYEGFHCPERCREGREREMKKRFRELCQPRRRQRRAK